MTTDPPRNPSPDRPAVDHDALGAALFEARRTRTPIAPLRHGAALDVDDAYRIQSVLVQRLMDEAGDEAGDGASRVIGYKLGLTSAPMQRMLGVDEPDYGPVLSHMAHDDGAELVLDDFIQPKVEAEIALRLGEDLTGPGITVDDARRAVSGAAAAIEVVDSRIVDWDIQLVDTIADLASSAAIVVGGDFVEVGEIDLRLVGMVIECNGALVDTGAGAAALGDPIGAVAWLANTLAPHGVTLEAGHVIMTGSLHAAFEVAVGDVVEATFDRLGGVACSFR